MKQTYTVKEHFTSDTLEAINTLSTAYQRISVREGSKQQSKLLEKIEQVMSELLSYEVGVKNNESTNNTVKIYDPEEGGIFVEADNQMLYTGTSLDKLASILLGLRSGEITTQQAYTVLVKAFSSEQIDKIY